MNKNDLFRMVEVGANVQQSMKLRSLEKQMQDQVELQQEQYLVEQEQRQRQLQIKDLVFKIKTAFDEVKEENDMLVRSVLLGKLLSVINQNKITVEEFEAISDKEYAHNVLQALENTLDDAFSRLTESDKKDLDDLGELKVGLDKFDEKLNSLLLQHESEKEKLAPLLAQQEKKKEKLAPLLAQKEKEKEKLASLSAQKEKEKEKLASLLAQKEKEKEKLASLSAQKEKEKLNQIMLRPEVSGNAIPKPNLKNPVRFSLGGFGVSILAEIIDIPALVAIGLGVSFFSLIWLIWRCALHRHWARWVLFIFLFPIWLIWFVCKKKERKILKENRTILKQERKILKQERKILRQEGKILRQEGKILKQKEEIQRQEDEIQKQTIDLQKIENLVSELETKRQENLDHRGEIISRHPGLDAQFSPQLSLQR